MILRSGAQFAGRPTAKISESRDDSAGNKVGQSRCGSCPWVDVGHPQDDATVRHKELRLLARHLDYCLVPPVINHDLKAPGWIGDHSAVGRQPGYRTAIARQRGANCLTGIVNQVVEFPIVGQDRPALHETLSTDSARRRSGSEPTAATTPSIRRGIGNAQEYAATAR